MRCQLDCIDGTMFFSVGSRLTHKKIVGVRIRPSNLEQLHQVVKLAVDIATHRHRAFLSCLVSTEWLLPDIVPTYHGLHIRFFLKDLASLRDDVVSISLFAVRERRHSSRSGTGKAGNEVDGASNQPKR